MKSKSNALSLKLKEVFDPEFVREVIDRRIPVDATTPRATLLRSQTSTTIVRKRILATFAGEDEQRQLSVLATLTSSEVRSMAKLGKKTLRWFEEYLHLLGIVLPRTRSIHGMSQGAQQFLRSLG